ncbi:MAG: ClpXP protease specificity-enhancing factor [Curvibacter sp. PD_MW3]|nr:MAG: ClpXP protease specificity-enhancing factor [Curvibacter sp. PD_MW3]
MMNAPSATSTRPYLIRALYEWCTDNGFTPYVAVRVDETVQVPREYVKNGEIVLNVSMDATSSLKLGNEFIEFKARFAGTARDIMVPVSRVIAIYARENGQGMAFPLEEAGTPAAQASEVAPELPTEREPEVKTVQLTRVDSARSSDEPEPPRPPGGNRPALKRVK